MSDVRTTDKVALASVGDLHLTLDPPAFRSGEKNWLATQAGYLGQVQAVVDHYKVPLVCTGDIFDDGWREKKCPPELINFVIEYLPDCYAVAGNHDLPHHRLDQINRSAYWTLRKSLKITHLQPKPLSIPIRGEGTYLLLHGFSWGEEIQSPKPIIKSTHDISVAVCHKYIWIEGHEFPGVTIDSHVDTVARSNLKDYHAAVFGDNHKPFLYHADRNAGNCHILNGGGFMRRRSDEKDHRPFIGLLNGDRGWRKFYLDISEDVTLDPKTAKEAESSMDISGLIALLAELGDSALDFEAVVRQTIDRHKIPPEVKAIALRCMGVRQ